MAPLPEVLGERALANSFLGDLIQVCVVARDHRRALEGMVRLGIGPWTIRRIDATRLADFTYRGAPATTEMILCLANARDMNWEVIEPLSGPSIYADFLARHGDGVQHLAFNGGDLPYPERVARLTALGYQPVQTGTLFGGIRFAYFATEPDFGSVIEVFDVPAGFRLPAPDAWYPAPPPG